jgi:hypothetical protein
MGAIFYGTGNTVINYGIITEPNAAVPPSAGVAFADANNVLINKQGGTLGSGYESEFYATTDYPHRMPQGNRVGLHYSQFQKRLVSGTGAFARRLRKPGLNPRSWVRRRLMSPSAYRQS